MCVALLLELAAGGSERFRRSGWEHGYLTRDRDQGSGGDTDPTVLLDVSRAAFSVRKRAATGPGFGRAWVWTVSSMVVAGPRYPPVLKNDGGGPSATSGIVAVDGQTGGAPIR